LKISTGVNSTLSIEVVIVIDHDKSFS